MDKLLTNSKFFMAATAVSFFIASGDGGAFWEGILYGLDSVFDSKAGY